MINSQSIATLGIGFGALAVSALGFIADIPQENNGFSSGVAVESAKNPQKRRLSGYGKKTNKQPNTDTTLVVDGGIGRSGLPDGTVGALHGFDALASSDQRGPDNSDGLQAAVGHGELQQDRWDITVGGVKGQPGKTPLNAKKGGKIVFAGLNDDELAIVLAIIASEC